jgi:hypothetical protein
MFAIVAKEAVSTNRALKAIRSMPLESGDSGWQVVVDSDEITPENAQVWSIDEVCQAFPGFGAFVNLEPGTVLSRSHDEWWVVGSSTK